VAFGNVSNGSADVSLPNVIEETPEGLLDADEFHQPRPDEFELGQPARASPNQKEVVRKKKRMTGISEDHNTKFKELLQNYNSFSEDDRGSSHTHGAGNSNLE
jgi:hypothetical protein